MRHPQLYFQSTHANEGAGRFAPNSGLSGGLRVAVERCERLFEGYYLNTESLSGKPFLATDAKALDKSLVALRIAIFQVIEQFSTACHHAQQTTPGMMIFLMRLEVLGQQRNTLTQKGNLDLWRARIRFVDPVLANCL